LPPPPNFLENCINPLENEIYPKVIVQPAHQPWVLPRDLNGGDPPKVEVQPPVAVPVSGEVAVPVSGEVATSTTQSQPAVSEVQLHQKLQLFGPDVQLSQLQGHDPARYKAVRQEANGDQSQLVFTAQQLVSFSQSHGKFIEMVSAQGHLPTPTPAMISHYFPGPGGQLVARPKPAYGARNTKPGLGIQDDCQLEPDKVFAACQSFFVFEGGGGIVCVH